MGYSYDRRIVTANMSLEDAYWSQWQRVLDEQRKLEDRASQRVLKEFAAQIINLGFKLDLKKSSISTQRSGSDSWMHHLWLTMKDEWYADRGDVLTPDFVADIVFDAGRFQPRARDVKQKSPGLWTVSYEWGG